MERRHPHRNGYRYSPDECVSHQDDDGHRRDDSKNTGQYHHHHHHHHHHRDRDRDDYDRHHCDEQLLERSSNHASPSLPSLNAALPHHRHHRQDDVEATRRMLRFHPPERKEEGRTKFTSTSTSSFTFRSAIRVKREEDEAIIRPNRTQFSETSTVTNDGNTAKAASDEKHSLLAEHGMNTDVLYSPKGGNDYNRNPHTHNATNLQQQQQHDHDDSAPAHVNTIASSRATTGNMRENSRYYSIATNAAALPSSCQQPQPQPQPQQHNKDVIFSRHPTIIHTNRPRNSLKQSAGKECKSSNHDHFPLHEHPASSSIAIPNSNPTCDETGNSTRANKSYFRSNNNHDHNNNNRNNINNIRDKKKKYDVNNLMKLPSHHASSSAKFPPGCPVVYHYRVPHPCSDDRPDTTRGNLTQNGNAITADNPSNGNNVDHNHVRIHVGKVQSVYIDFSSASRELVHAISTKKGKGTNAEDEGEELLLIDENSLAYAPQCPIVFHPASASGRGAGPPDVIGDDGTSVGNALGDGAGDGIDVSGMEGIVLLCRTRLNSSGSDSGDYGGDERFVYTILLHVPHDEGLLIKENVEIENISYRPKHDDDLVDVVDRKCIAMMGYNREASTMEKQPIVRSGNESPPDGGEHRSRQAGGLNQIDVNSYRNGSSNWRAQTTASGTVHTRRNDDTSQCTTEKSFVRGKVDSPVTSDYCTKEDDRTKENQMPLAASRRNTQNQSDKAKSGISIASDVCMKGDNRMKENQVALSAPRRKNIQKQTNEKEASYTKNDHSVVKQTTKCNNFVPQTVSNDSISSKNTKVFVQNLCASDVERGVRDYFARFGKVVSLTLPLFSSSKTHRNCAMIEFESSQSSAAVVSKGTHSFLGRTLSVRYYDDQRNITATPNDLTPKRESITKDKRIGRTERDYRVFVSNIRISDHTDEDIRSYFSQFGAVARFERYQRRTDLGEVEFQSCGSSAAATSKTVHVLNGHRIHVLPYDPTNNSRGSKKLTRENTRNNDGDRDVDTASRARRTAAAGNGRRTKRPMIGEPLHSKRPCLATKPKAPESGICKPDEDILSNWWMPPR